MDAVNNNRGKGSASPAGAERNPGRTRRQILEAALAEFAEKGLGGARVDEIARRAGANKRMLYHYFGNKDALFLAALELAYGRIRRAESELKLHDLDPVEGMRRLVSFTFTFVARNTWFVHLLNSENLYLAGHLKDSASIREMHSPLVDVIEDLLRRGQKSGAFRGGVDPVQLYITIAALGYFYFSNIHTLSAIFGRNLSSAAARRERHDHAVDAVLGYLRPSIVSV